MASETDESTTTAEDQLPFSDHIPFRMVMIAVAQHDLEKLDEFAEALMVRRYPAMATEIRQLRQELFLKYNKEEP